MSLEHKRDLLLEVANEDMSYADPKRKSLFHSRARGFLSALAKELGYEEYDLRSNKAGIAVSGEITLHTDDLYVQISQSCMFPGTSLMLRTCEGRRDYSGGVNHHYEIHTPIEDIIETIKTIKHDQNKKREAKIQGAR
jgi:hypothetical protein